ncbi:Manganese-dependent ADP-ribose/CDP-alcohol diphosphatase, partial [Diplonema papillatum]
MSKGNGGNGETLMRAGKARNRSVRYTPYPSRRPMLKFGVIADVQYADEDDGANFDKSRTRYYRDGLRKLRRAVDWWKREGVSFALDLGDVIDGGNGAKGEQDGALRAVLAAFDELGKPVTHVVGNHERMNFSKAALSQRKEWSPEGAGGRLYHSWCLPGKVAGSAWKVLVLNAYEHAAIRHDDPMLRKLPLCSEPDYTICRDLLLSRNPNLAPDERAWYSGVYWGSGLADSDARFLPYNGMFGAEQLR